MCKIVFLYTELAGYTISCIESLAASGAEILVFRYPVNNEAPFVFKNSSQFILLNRRDFSFSEMQKKIQDFSPQSVFCSGWIDKEYVKLCGFFKKLNVKTVLCLDNQWRLSARQILAVMASPLFIKPNFNFAWVPGKIQRRFVAKLGFKQKNIFEGFYCADTDKWSDYYFKNKESKKNNFPKKFIYIGRYYDFKGVTDLWSAFILFSAAHPDWELLCLGTGDVVPVQHPKIKHLGFVQPDEIEKFVAMAGVFVLPSRFEPWGVVVHEMAAAGFPMILSNAVGAAEAFLSEPENGFYFEKENVQQLSKVMAKMAELKPEELYTMSEESHRLSEKITLGSWVNTINEINKKLL